MEPASQSETPHQRSADSGIDSGNDRLLVGKGPFRECYLDAHGAGGKLCPEYDASIRELTVLFEFWYRALTEVRMFQHSAGTTGSRERGDVMLAEDRLQELHVQLGDELSVHLMNGVDEKFKEELGESVWNDFFFRK